jgi:hypothetical protein
MTAIP